MKLVQENNTCQSILVTGANSPLGIEVCRLAHTAGHYVIGSVRDKRAYDKTTEIHEIINLNFEDPRSFNNIPYGLDCIIHIASTRSGSPETIFKVIGLGTHSLVQAAKRLKINKIIHVSSMSVYGAVTESLVTARTPIKCSTPHGSSKWAAESFLREASADVASVSIRSPAIVGRFAKANFLAKLVEDMANGLDTVYVRNPQFMFNNLVHYKTLARFLFSLAETSFISHRSFPIGAKDPLPLSEVVSTLASHLIYEGHVTWESGGSSPFSVDTEEAKEYGFIPNSVKEELLTWMNELKPSLG
jgi:nucleoside-diphosphate-sugar epimerase